MTTRTNARELLNVLIDYLGSPEHKAKNAKIAAANPCRIHLDPTDHSIAYQTNRDGSVTKGTLLDNGDFVPDAVK